jgi:hypothetical protein
MSGQKALASAKNRRAGGNSRPSPASRSPARPPPAPRSSARVPPPPSSPQESMEYDPNTFQEEQQKPTNARTMLIGHDQSIRVLREAVTNLELQTTSQIKKTQDQIQGLSLDDSNIEYFKTKIASIEKQMNEIKKHIIKVQTFAMETNLQCIEMKKKKEDDSSVLNQQQFEEATQISSILTNDNNEEVVDDIQNNTNEEVVHTVAKTNYEELVNDVDNNTSKKEIHFN